MARFYTLYPAVLLYANQQLGLARQVTTIPQLMAMSEEDQYALRAAFYEHREIIEAFVHANPQGFSDEDFALVASWTHLVHVATHKRNPAGPQTLLDAAHIGCK
jgi:hypothetical protein